MKDSSYTYRMNVQNAFCTGPMSPEVTYKAGTDILLQSIGGAPDFARAS